MEYEGDAFQSNGVIQLTKDQADCSGRAIYGDPVRIWDRATGRLADFTTHFSFSIDTLHQSNHGDGLAFFLAANKSLPSNSAGSCLGLVNCKNELSTPPDAYVAVEFDTFPNPWDPKYDHIGINLNSLNSVETVEWRFESKVRNRATVSYDSSTKNFSVFLSYDDSPTANSSASRPVDLRKYLPEWVTIGFSASTGGGFQIHSVLDWDFQSSLGAVAVRVPRKKKNMLVVEVVPCVVVTVLAGLGLIRCLLGLIRCLRRKKRSRSNDDGPEACIEIRMEQIRHHETHEHGALEEPTTQNTIPGTSAAASGNASAFGGTTDEMRPTPQSTIPARDTMVPPASGTRGNTFPKKFSYQELVDATNNFKDSNSIGEGGFGEVLKGSLGDQNLEVAIKKLTKRKRDREKQFDSEVKTLGLLRHENLVQLYGWCNEETELLLVYEFMPNGSLWDCLFKEKRLLAWKERYKIVLDLANGLLHLHEEKKSYIIHRDIKSSNVLLDVNFKAKLGDFGLARLVEEGEDPITTYIAGTKGYLAPECRSDRQKPSKESDVYSFGVVALEIGCGRRALGSVNEPIQELVEWVWMLYGKGNILEAADLGLCKEFNENEMKCLLVVGLWCAHPDPSARPTIRKAIDMLSRKAPLSPLVPQVKVDGSSSSDKPFMTASSGNPNEN